MANQISVGIDIGTQEIKVVVTENSKTESGALVPHIIATGLAESKGLRHGYVIHAGEAARSVHQAILQAEKIAKIKIKRAYISVGGIGLGSITGKGIVTTTRADSEVTDADVKNALETAENELSPAALLNKKIIHVIPLSYKIDDQVVIGRPAGMHGAKLEAKVLFLTCLEQHLNDLIRVVEEAGVEVQDVMASPLAASLVSLSKTQRVAGCVLINLGAETLSMAVFENNIPLSLEVFPIGSTDITNDIALSFRIPIEEAEKVKKTNNGETKYPKKKYEDLVNSRLSDMLGLVESQLKKLGRSGLLPAGVILTGAGSGIHTLEDIARTTLKLPAKTALTNFAGDGKHPTELKDAVWSVAFGLSTWGLTNGEDTSGISTSSGKSNRTLHNFVEWCKQFLP